MREWNEFFGSEFVSYFSADSSPQGKRDWLNVTCCRVKAADLIALFQLVGRLVSMRDDLHDLSDAQKCEAIGMLTDLHQQKLQHRACTPVSIGSAASGLRHKMHGLLHTLRLEEASWGRVCLCMNSGVNCTTDAGTEFGLGLFEPFRITDMFPWAADEHVAGAAGAPIGMEVAGSYGFELSFLLKATP